MDKSQIPTTTITIGKGEDKKDVLLYEWITQSEDDEYQSLLTMDQTIKQSQVVDGVADIGVTMRALSTARTYLVKAYLVNMTPAEYDILRPDLRKELLDKIEELHSKKK